jgi:lipoprotein-anchoring transpeptidase ErfK/SrfK
VTTIRSTGGLLAAAAAFAVLTIAAAPAAATAEGSGFPRAGVILSSKLVVRATPSTSSRALKVLRQFRSDYRPTEVLAVAEAEDAAGSAWLKISLPMRPNGRFGWVRANLVQVRPITTTIVVSRAMRTLSLSKGGNLLFKTRVAVGKPGAPTPLGFFYVTARYKATERALGVFAFETSAYSSLSEWPGGGVVGIHGTPQPQLLGKAVSHGCIRISNAAALTLKRLAPVGTPVRIVR